MKHAQNYFIRELVQDDFTDLDKHFGPHTPYKNPLSKWEKYLHLQNIGDRSIRVVEKDDQ